VVHFSSTPWYYYRTRGAPLTLDLLKRGPVATDEELEEEVVAADVPVDWCDMVAELVTGEPEGDAGPGTSGWALLAAGLLDIVGGWLLRSVVVVVTVVHVVTVAEVDAVTVVSEPVRVGIET